MLPNIFAAAQADLRLFKSLPPAATATLLATTAIISILGSRPNSSPASVRIFFFFHFALLFLSHQNPTQPSAHPHAVFIFPPLLSVVAFVPAHTYGSHAYFWNLVSYAFVETNLLLFVIDALAMLTFLPIFERMWGVTETACFFLASAVCAALLLLVSIVALFALTLDWSVLQVSIDVAVACAPLIFLESSPSTSGSPLQPALSSCSSPRYTRTKAFLPSQAKTCPGPTQVPFNLCRCFCCFALFLLKRYAVVCCTLRIISGGVFEALLVLYGGAAGLISLFVDQNFSSHIQHSTKNLAHASLLSPAWRAPASKLDACARQVGSTSGFFKCAAIIS